MRLSTFIAKKESVIGNEIVLNEDINHMKNVLRLGKGDAVRVIDGENEYFCRINEVRKGEALLAIEEKGDKIEQKSDVTAAVSILKSGPLSTLIQKLTELGISKFIPLLTSRTSVKEFNHGRWSKVSREALKQCGGISFMDIEDISKIDEIPFEEYSTKIVAYEGEKEAPFSSAGNIKNRGKIIYVVGPEGGFEGDEINFLKNKGFKTITLGERILRSETAAILLGGGLVNGW